MNPEILEQLKDIHQSAPVGWWPLAWGWWVLLICLAILLVASVYVIRQHYLRRIAKNQSLKALSQIQAQAPDWAVQVHLILRRVCLSYFPTEHVAKLHGDAWLDFLLAQLPAKRATQLAPTLKQLIMSQYQPTTTPLNFDDVSQCVKQWINTACPGKSKPQQKELSHV